MPEPRSPNTDNPDLLFKGLRNLIINTNLFFYIKKKERSPANFKGGGPDLPYLEPTALFFISIPMISGE